MPIFEYKCSKCGHVTEFLERTTAARKHICEECNSSDLRKLLSGFAVGQSKSAGNACETCPSGPCPTSACQNVTCQLS